MHGRKRGGQPGNVNALKHGQRSKRFTSERRAGHGAEIERRHAREREWAAAAPKTDYGAICDAIRFSERQKRGFVNFPRTDHPYLGKTFGQSFKG